VFRPNSERRANNEQALQAQQRHAAEGLPIPEQNADVFSTGESPRRRLVKGRVEFDTHKAIEIVPLGVEHVVFGGARHNKIANVPFRPAVAMIFCFLLRRRTRRPPNDRLKSHDNDTLCLLPDYLFHQSALSG
jgi:hypothetical protein